jgi:4-carboxymuconolactone decarboxylase
MEPNSRIALPDPDRLTPAQAEAYERIASGPRGKVEGPLAIWLHSPELANRAQLLGEFARYRTSFAPRLSELAILIVARHWTSHFEWAIHSRIAAEAGVSPSLTEAIRIGATPQFEDEEQAAIHAFVTELLANGKTSDATLGTIRSLFGDQATVELAAIVGYYSLCAFTLALAEPELPDGTRECLPQKAQKTPSGLSPETRT